MFRRITIVVAGATIVGALLAVSFVIGLQAGAERSKIYRRARYIKAIDRLFVDLPQAESEGTNDTGKRVPALDAAAITQAQSRQVPPANAREWAGFYRVVNLEKDLAGLKPLNQWLPAVIWPRMQPWARARMEATDGVADDTGTICQPIGIFRTTAFSGSFLLLPALDKVVIVHAPIETAGVQRVYLNRAHPRNLLPTWNGDSVGYWEGDTLVVDTIGFNDKSWLHPSMEPHSEDTRFVQRFRQVRGGDFMEVHYAVEDRQALTSAYTYSRYYKRIGDHMPEDVCNDDVQIYREFRNQALKAQLDRARRIE
jgi:hypothetical protein